MLITIGIDPGRMGAVAFLGDGAPEVYDCPSHTIKVGKKDRIRCNPHGMVYLLEPYRDVMRFSTHVFIEKVGPMPKQGVTSMFTFGEGFGFWQGILAAFKIPYTLVTPQRWTKELKVGKGKDGARVRAVQLFPIMNGQLGTKAKGRADALLIAEYGRRELGR